MEQLNLIKQLYNAIEEHDTKKAIDLLKNGVNPNILLEEEDAWGTLGLSIWEHSDIGDNNGSINVFYALLTHGADTNMSFNGSCYPIHAAIRNRISDKNLYLKILTILLKNNANPNVFDDYEFGLPLYQVIGENDIDTSLLLLKYGANTRINIMGGTICNCSSLHLAISRTSILSLKLLLDNGADPAIPDEYGDSMLSVLERNKEKYTQEDYIKVQKLLNPNNPPYLKLGDNEEDKYIIYENIFFEDLMRGIVSYTNVKPFLLTDKTSYKNKKYLYTDNKIDTFIYWAYTKGLLKEQVVEKVKHYLEGKDIKNKEVLNNLMKKSIGNELTIEDFNAKDEKFASSYLIVTHWWYNLHTDFNRLFNEKNKKPKAIENEKEFDTLMKLLNIRYEQFLSGKDFNSNQNKEELEALIERKEPPKRVIDLSFLKE